MIYYVFNSANTKDCPVDVIFVLDASASVNEQNFNLTKSFLSELVGRLDVDSGHTRVGLVPFSANVSREQAFNLIKHLSTASVQSAISSLNYATLGGTTHTAAALRYVRTDMLTSVAGDRPKTANVVFVLTDGESNVNQTQTKVCTSAGNVRRKT